MAKKQTFVVGSTNPITASKTDAQLNVGWDQFEVLNAEDLDGVFNAVSAQSQINSEEITNALDVYNVTPDPTDNTQLKQVLTTMDNKINQVVSGGEIIGSFWFGQTTSGFTVPAPTIIGQTYIDFTTLDHYISNDGSTWTYNGTLTLPALQDAIVLVTSKFWDIPEQQDQYGGRAIWSHDLSQWIYYPTIINLAGYAHTDMDNLTSTGANIGNWSSNVSNCITNIPQDIKLELNAGTFTLKAGSKVYVPNGAGVFDEIVTQSDLSITPPTENNKLVLFYKPSTDTLTYNLLSICSSGTSVPASFTGMFYNTVDNTIKGYYNGSTSDDLISFPLAIITNSSTVNSIDQVFNGFGYIGLTTFVLPGVRGLIPNGRKADGTCKNTEIAFANVTINTLSLLFSLAFLDSTGVSSFFESQTTHYYVSPTPPETAISLNARWYDTTNNIIWDWHSGTGTWTQYNGIFLGTLFKGVSDTQITSFTPCEPFKAISSSDILALLNLLYPIGSLYITTVNSNPIGCPIASLIPGSKWSLVATDKALWGGNGGNAATSIAAGLPNITGLITSNNYAGTAAADSALYPTGNGKNSDIAGSGPNAIGFDASRSNTIYGKSTTVQPPAYRVNVWRRVS